MRPRGDITMTCFDRHAVAKLLEQRQQALVDDQDAILGVVDDVGELVGVQAQVQRVQHRADRRDRQVRLEVLMPRPGERRHAIARRTPSAWRATARRRTRSRISANECLTRLLSGRRLVTVLCAKSVSARRRWRGSRAGSPSSGRARTPPGKWELRNENLEGRSEKRKAPAAASDSEFRSGATCPTWLTF